MPESDAGDDDIAPAEQYPFPLEQCIVKSIFRSSYRVQCKICGYTGSTTLNRLIYGHYLGHPKKDIRTCVSRAILEEKHKDFYDELKRREDSCKQKRE